MIVSMFHLSPRVLQAIPGLVAPLRTAGIRHVELDAVYELGWIPWCIDNDFRIIAIGDNFMRTPGDVEKNCHYAEVVCSANQLHDSGICDGIEMVDEVKQDPAAYPMAAQFVKWWRDACGPPMAWPGHAPQRWETPELSDYDSRQWNHDTCRNGRDRLDRLRGALADPPKPGRKRCVMIDVSGWHYTKVVPGTEFQSGEDTPLYGRSPPSVWNIERQLDNGLSLGATRFRLWAHDAWWFQQRAKAAIGDECWTGMGQGDGRWPGFLEVVRGFVGESGSIERSQKVI